MGGTDARFRLALGVGKLAQGALHLVGRSGGQLPGVVAERICPRFLARVGKPERVAFVMGTNGKTTTANLLGDILRANGVDFADNRAGGNVTEGIESTLMANADLSGAARRQLAVMELDELHSRLVLKDVTPDFVLVTNLYRDGFVRNADPDYVGSVISRAMPASTTLVLNGDELVSARLAPQCERRVYYSVTADLPGDTRAAQGIVSDLPVCPECGGALAYERCHLRHIGQLRCTSCGYTNPDPDYVVTSVDIGADGSGSFVMRERATQGEPGHRYHIAAYSVTNLYNLAAAVVMARLLGVPAEGVARALESGVNVTASRYKDEVVEGVHLVDVLAKAWNVPADSTVFRQIRDDPGSKAVVVMVNDHHKEGRDGFSDFTGWSYSADFEYLADPSVRQVVFAGDRAADFELRMLVAGGDPARITCVASDDEIGDAVRLDVDRVYWTYELYCRDIVNRAHARVAERLRERG